MKRFYERFSFLISPCSSRNGFTLIELLVVLAIIGILSSFIMVNLIGAKARARDAQRKSDLRQMQAAFELYRSDQGSYPTDPEVTCGSPLTKNGTNYMSKIPCDPLDPSYVYKYTSSGNPPSSYTLKACLENSNDSQQDNINTCSKGVSYTLANP